MPDENVIKNLANETVRDCATNGVQIDIDFAIYFIKLTLMNPKYGKWFTTVLNRTNLEYFVDHMVSVLSAKDAAIVTLKMQHTYMSMYLPSLQLIHNHEQTITQCLEPLLSEIRDTIPENDDRLALEKLMRKISIYILLASGLGNPGNITVLKEGMAALTSVFTIEDLTDFSHKKVQEKNNQLEELIGLVSGVRLFNRDCKKGGEGINDLPQNLSDAGQACSTSLSNSLIRIIERVNILTSAIDENIHADAETGILLMKPKDGVNLKEEDFQTLCRTLFSFRQHEMYIRKLMADVDDIMLFSRDYMGKLKEAFEEVHATVKYRAAVPVTLVFPHFVKLWQLWRNMQNEMYLISHINQLMNNLDSLQEQVQLPMDTINEMLASASVLTDQQRMSKIVTKAQKLRFGALANYMTYDGSRADVKDYHYDFAYLGFCAVSICKGALIPGNPKIGTIKWKRKLYIFSSAELTECFGKNPNRYIKECMEYARNNPHIINFLGISNEVFELRFEENLVETVVLNSKSEDKEIQTLVHPVPQNITKGYSWNMWDYKKEACQWSTIVKCVTHSTQTELSHMRSELQCQTEEKRTKELTTKKDNGTNVPTLKTFIWGLRGQRNDQQHVINLTRPVNE